VTLDLFGQTIELTAALIVLNVAYVIYTVSAAFKDVFLLRVLLLAATVLYIVYGVIAPNRSIFLWNLPVAALHIWALWGLFSERRGIDLNEEAESIRVLFFPGLDRAKFNVLWHNGEERIIRNQVLITKGEQVPELFMVLDGEAEVMSGQTWLRLSRFHLLGEMSSLTGTTANATVQAVGELRVRAWDKAELAALTADRPEINVALLKAMGQDAARKVGE